MHLELLFKFSFLLFWLSRSSASEKFSYSSRELYILLTCSLVFQVSCDSHGVRDHPRAMGRAGTHHIHHLRLHYSMYVKELLAIQLADTRSDLANPCFYSDCYGYAYPWWRGDRHCPLRNERLRGFFPHSALGCSLHDARYVLRDTRWLV
jgi:hypothetical protein